VPELRGSHSKRCGSPPPCADPSARTDGLASPFHANEQCEPSASDCSYRPDAESAGRPRRDHHGSFVQLSGASPNSAAFTTAIPAKTTAATVEPQGGHDRQRKHSSSNGTRAARDDRRCDLAAARAPQTTMASAGTRTASRSASTPEPWLAPSRQMRRWQPARARISSRGSPPSAPSRRHHCARRRSDHEPRRTSGSPAARGSQNIAPGLAHGGARWLNVQIAVRPVVGEVAPVMELERSLVQGTA
jgi:hypothetical protein